MLDGLGHPLAEAVSAAYAVDPAPFVDWVGLDEDGTQQCTRDLCTIQDPPKYLGNLAQSRRNGQPRVSLSHVML